MNDPSGLHKHRNRIRRRRILFTSFVSVVLGFVFVENYVSLSRSSFIKNLTDSLNFGSSRNLDPHVEFKKKGDAINKIRALYENRWFDKADLKELLIESKKTFSKTKMVYHVPLPTINEEIEEKDISKKGVTVVGDIHGKFYNVIEIFKVNGFPSRDRPYIFNGDINDMGQESLETILSLLVIKQYCSECIYINRGDHETEKFMLRRTRGQVMEHYDEEIWQLLRGVLHQLPLATIVDKKILVIHGGIPRADWSLKEINYYKRKDRNPGQEFSEDGLEFADSLWATPWDENGLNSTHYVHWGPDISNEFLARESLHLIVRGHTWNPSGWYKSHQDRVWTLHSDPHVDGELGAFLNIYSNDHAMKIEQFKAPWMEGQYVRKLMDWHALLVKK